MALNEDFWIDKQLKHLYNFFDEIIICEGVELKTNTYDIGWTNEDISKNTILTPNMKRIINSFPDPDNKIKYIEYGKCNDKVELNNEMYKASTGDYVWEIDADEFYHLDAMNNIKNYLIANADVNQINFRMYHFIDFNNCIHGVGGERWGDNFDICRIFRREDGNTFISHRPPNIKYKTNGRIITRNESLKYGWVMYHYSYVFDWQIEKKMKYYPNTYNFKSLKTAWEQDHSKPLLYGSKTTPFTGIHPKIIKDYIQESQI